MLRFVLIAAFITAAFGGVSRIPATHFKDGRIVGGRDVEIKDFPYQLSLEFSGNHDCGASLIAPDVAITAGHCAFNFSASYLSVRAGSSLKEKEGTVVKVEKVRQHPNYSNSNLNNDVSILILQEPLELGENVGLIGLVEENQEIAAGTVCTISGWGSRSPRKVSIGAASDPNQLQAADIPIVIREDCEQAYAAIRPLTESMFCAGNKEGGKDSCQGDSGGPLVCNGLLAGIVSWGKGCAQAGYPGVYAKVSNLRGFIRDASGV